MNQDGFIKDIKGMVFCPRINALPVLTFVFDVEVWLWCSIVVNPVKCQQRDIGCTHYTPYWLGSLLLLIGHDSLTEVLTKIIDAMVCIYVRPGVSRAKLEDSQCIWGLWACRFGNSRGRASAEGISTGGQLMQLSPSFIHHGSQGNVAGGRRLPRPFLSVPGP